jgi:DNA-directed RNA polymerase subunit K/omega
VTVIRLPPVNAYELAVVSALRAHQLMQGSVPRLQGSHKATTMARMEVSLGKVVRLEGVPDPH